jgi:hypothetical protein
VGPQWNTHRETLCPVNYSKTKSAQNKKQTGAGVLVIPALRRQSRKITNLRPAWATWQDPISKNQGLEMYLVVEHLPSMYDAIGSIVSTEKKIYERDSCWEKGRRSLREGQHASEGVCLEGGRTTVHLCRAGTFFFPLRHLWSPYLMSIGCQS